MKINSRYEDDAESVVNALCETADRQGWTFDKRITEGVTYIIFRMPGQEWAEGILVSADGDSGILEMAARLLENTPAGKRTEAAAAANVYNFGRLLGMLEMDIATGEVWYKIKLSIAGCRGGLMNWQELMGYICREAAICRKLLIRLNSGNMTLKEILRRIKQQS